jgi:DNA-binding NtrC family response regulator
MNGGVRVLAVDDNSDALFALEALLRDAGFDVVGAGSGTETLKKVQDTHPDVILLDVQMPAPDGFEVTKILKQDERYRYIPIILLTGKELTDDIVHGLSLGANDYVTKPYSADELLARIRTAMRTKELYAELQRVTDEAGELRREKNQDKTLHHIIGNSDAMKAVFRMIDKIKDSSASVLITGESGTGKELVAHALHTTSTRKEKPFVAQNVSALQDTLLESELFGHVRGAFTGAVKDKLGLFAIADGGTLFLDELGEMSPSMQAKLLRVLQDGTFVPVGDTRPKKVDVRVIGATHRKLGDMISRGEFREDLYYRLSVIELELPPLRERTEDIPLLVESFLLAYEKRTGFSKKTVSKDVMQMLQRYRWPGNVRQLQNEVERMMLLSGDDSVVQADSLSPAVRGAPVTQSTTDAPGEVSVGNLKSAIEQLERRMIQAAMKLYKNNKSEVAKVLGISRSGLILKVQTYFPDESDES